MTQSNSYQPSIVQDGDYLHAYVANETGPFWVCSEQIDWQCYDTPEKAKNAADLALRNRAAEHLRTWALMFQHGKVEYV